MDLIDWGSKPQPSSDYWWGFKLLWIASTLKYRQGSVLKQYSIRSEVVGLDYLAFTSLHGTPLRPPWKGQHCPLLITVSSAAVSNQSPEVCRACVYYPWPQQYDDWGWNIFTGGWPCYPFYPLAENMQVRKEWVGVGEDQFHEGVWRFPTRLFPIFLATFYITGPDQHSIHHSNPLADSLLFSLT